MANDEQFNDLDKDKDEQIVFQNKREFDDNFIMYKKMVGKVIRYLKVGGMFEILDGQDYSLLGGLNTDRNTWKEYEIKKSFQVNSHGLLELHFNIADAVLLGTQQSIDKMAEVLNKFQIKAMINQIKKDAYFIGCKAS